MCFVIFGYGNADNECAGQIYGESCPKCNSNKFSQLIRTTKWFTFFFIPLIPYSTRYWLHCPVCRHSNEIDNREFNRLRPTAELNDRLHRGLVTFEEYEKNEANQMDKLMPVLRQELINKVRGGGANINDV